MSIREIPRAFVYICDGCSKEHKQENANGHYTDSRPPHWIRLKLARTAYDYQGRTAYDYQGAACADASIERLLCEDCSPKVEAAISAAVSSNDTGKSKP